MRFPGLLLLLFGAPRSASGVRLGHRRIFILPTRLGLGFGLLLGAMLLTAMNYQNNLAYAFVFLAASTALTSAIHTYANLAGIVLAPVAPSPVFAGQPARFPVRVSESRGSARFGLEVVPPRGQDATLDLDPGKDDVAQPTLPTRQRGLLPAPELLVRTTHPLGLFRAWSRVRFDRDCLVYPRPAEEASEAGLLRSEGAGAHGEQNAAGGEDLDSLRQYRDGEPAGRIDWKAYARGRGLVTKDFSGTEPAAVWLDFDALPRAAGTEERLSRLARLILDLSRTGTEFGLRLPGTSIAPDSGERHVHACLAELALFGEKRKETA